jgi:hypothetical protein
MEYATRTVVLFVMVNALWCVGNALSPHGNGKCLMNEIFILLSRPSTKHSTRVYYYSILYILREMSLGL